ncbi:hypothetical protein GCM10010442_49960 [Kitasatospora kifunensis]|uniref:Mutator family transposase n=1 Tax=Kitasatospora kifunensis TaxID=58351 RepID=A0A7W7VTT2_KITKI|nr:hypothetical protein [Kitasatospora kifunensis]
MADRTEPVSSVADETVVDEVVERLMERADASGAALLGEGGLLTEITRAVLERALEAEMTGHLGYEKHDPAGRGSGNSRNGTSAKTVLTDVGAVTVAVPRDRNGDFEPQLVPKNARRLAGFNDRILSLYARGMSVRDIRSHLARIYGVEVSPDLISKVTDAVVDELAGWQNRPLDAVWPVIYIDALWVKIRSGAVASKPVHLAVGVDMDGRKDVLGLWAGDGGEGATTWTAVLTELRNRSVEDVCIVACDGCCHVVGGVASGGVSGRAGARAGLVQAVAGRLATPVIWSQIVKRTVISRRWSGAVRLWRPDRKWGEIPLKAARNRCAPPTLRKPFMARSRCLVGWWEFSARLFGPLWERCSTEGITSRWAAL